MFIKIALPKKIEKISKKTTIMENFLRLFKTYSEKFSFMAVSSVISIKMI